MWDAVAKKFRRKSASEKKKKKAALYLGGRITLIKSTFANFPIYYLFSLKFL